MKFISYANVKKMIESAIAECEQDMKDMLQGYRYTEQQLLEQIEELKAKVPQPVENIQAMELPPVEVEKDLADAIRYYKNFSHSGLNSWRGHFLLLSLSDSTEHPAKIIKTLNQITERERIEIIAGGYTVKPDPLRSGIASLVARYTNEDGVSGETDLIEKLAEYVRGHFGGETE